MAVSEAEAEDAARWLLDNAERIGALRARRIWAEEYRKSVKAIVMANYSDKPIGTQEREAYASSTYLLHLEVLREAVTAEQTASMEVKGKEAIIEFWRTQCANQRGRF